MTSKQIDKFLRDTFGTDNVHKINVSGCRFIRRGKADYFIQNRNGGNNNGFWMETKRLSEKTKKLQEEFLWSVNGYHFKWNKGKIELRRYYKHRNTSDGDILLIGIFSELEFAEWFDSNYYTI